MSPGSAAEQGSTDRPETVPENSVGAAEATALKLPNMNEFSPGVLGSDDLGPLLNLINRHRGDRDALLSAIAESYPRIDATGGEQRLNRANNVLIGMKECGLYDRDEKRLTELGENLRTTTEEARANEFAKHILTNLFGLELYDVVEVIRARGDAVTDKEIRRELRSRGFTVTENESNHGKLRQWMQRSGVVDADWNYSETRLRELTGATGGVLGEWRSLDRGQRAVLLEIKRRAEHSSDDWLDLGVVKRACVEHYGRSVFPEGRFRAAVISPLVESGWIDARGKGEGRGGKAGEVKPLAKLLDVKINLGVESRTTLPADLRSKLAIPLEKIFEDLESSDKHIKGIALELLALRLVRDVGLTPVAFRLRSHETGGAEVDLVADGVHLHYSRWMIQCKNTRSVDLSALAKEVGMAVMLRAHVVVLVTTGKFSGSVVEHAHVVEQTTPLQVILIDQKALRRYRTRGAAAMYDELRKQAEEVLTLKAPQVRGGGDS